VRIHNLSENRNASLPITDNLSGRGQGPDMGKCRPHPKPLVKAKSSLSGRNYS